MLPRFRRIRSLITITVIAQFTLSISGCGSSSTTAPAALTAQGSMATMVGRYSTGTYGTSAAEIVAFHASSKTIYAVNGAANRLEILDASTLGTTAIANPLTASNLTGTQMSFPATTTVKIAGVDTTINIGGGANSIAVHGDLMAVAVGNTVKSEKGAVLFYVLAGSYARNPIFVKAVQVGCLPDMVTFTPDGSKVVVANEGEPENDAAYTDPEGSIAIIDVTAGIPADTATIADFNAFDGQKAALATAGVKFANPGLSSVSQDLEPEYVTVSDDSKTAYVTLQENNAIALVDLTTKTVTAIKPLGFKDLGLALNALDISNKDSATGTASIKLQTVAGLYGMYQPDTIASYTSGGVTYLVTANEGDARDYIGYQEEIKVSTIATSLINPLSPSLLTVYDAAGGLNGLGQLKVSKAMGLNTVTGQYDKLYAFGGRSFSIWNTNGTLVYDSASLFEKTTSSLYPLMFNTNSTSNSFDSRSTSKGPEPEALAIGQVGSRTYAFIGLERMGGFFIFDISVPKAPVFIEHVINRDLTVTFSIKDTGIGHTGSYATAGDLAPEGMKFVPAASSPTGKALLLIGNETSGTVNAYQINER